MVFVQWWLLLIFLKYSFAGPQFRKFCCPCSNLCRFSEMFWRRYPLHPYSSIWQRNYTRWRMVTTTTPLWRWWRCSQRCRKKRLRWTASSTTAGLFPSTTWWRTALMKRTPTCRDDTGQGNIHTKNNKTIPTNILLKSLQLQKTIPHRYTAKRTDKMPNKFWWNALFNVFLLLFGTTQSNTGTCLAIIY